MISIIATYDKNHGLGLITNLLCHRFADIQNLQEQLSEKIVIMDDNTLASLLRKNKNAVNEEPLVGHNNIVLSCRVNPYEYHNIGEMFCNTNITFFNNIKDILSYIGDKNASIIGNNNIYEEFLQHDLVDKIYITEIYDIFETSTFFPTIPTDKYKWSIGSNYYYSITEPCYETFVLTKNKP